MFICIWMIRTSKVYIIRNKEIKSMVVSILQNLSQMYSSHNSYIKCVDSTIKYISFKLFHYVINIDDI